MHTPIMLSLAVVAWVAATAAAASMYKCAGTGSIPTYQESPCPPGRELRNFDTHPADVSVIPLRPIPGTSTRVSVTPPAKTKRDTTLAKNKGKVRGGDPAERKHIGVGMSDGEVVARIGEPDMTTGGKGRKLARWTYMPIAGDAHTITTLLLDFGKVVEVERKIVR
ncbi:MAG: hypothetical protein H0T80_10495 [Betaproteobacteria bacterium]|nr:hypothetical protein [Betaproteobacteria bacterium]